MYNRIHWINIIIRVTQYTGSYLVQIQFNYTYMSTAETNKICTIGAEQYKKREVIESIFSSIAIQREPAKT